MECPNEHILLKRIENDLEKYHFPSGISIQRSAKAWLPIIKRNDELYKNTKSDMVFNTKAMNAVNIVNEIKLHISLILK
jgi:hypothetical protein